MARAEPELRPCGIAADYVVASDMPTLRNSCPPLRSTRLEHSNASSTDSATAARVGITRTLTCYRVASHVSLSSYIYSIRSEASIQAVRLPIKK
jgi:hypothetical protein